MPGAVAYAASRPASSAPARIPDLSRTAAPPVSLGAINVRVNDCTIVGGTDVTFAPGTMGTFTGTPKGLNFLVGDDRGVRCDYDEVLAVEVAAADEAGQSLTASLHSSVANHVLGRLSARSNVNTLVGITMRRGSLVFHTSSVSAAEARDKLSVITAHLAPAG
jgi:hypothetical protein